MALPRTVPCPRCGVQCVWSSENRFRPFCSERCKMIDLGQWAAEAYRVPEAVESETGDEFPDPES